MGVVAVLRHVWLTRVRGTERARDVSDAVLTALAGLVLVASGLVGIWNGEPAGSPWVHAGPLAVGCLAMLGKRRHPVAALLAGVAVFAVDVALGGSVGLLLVLFDLVYSAALHAGPRAVLRLRAASWALVVLSLLVGWTATGELRITVFLGLQSFALVTTPLWWGLAVRRERELAALARARADDLRDLAELRAAEVRAEERAQMARDLHDAVAGNVSAIALHAEAALAHPAAPGGAADRERAALEAVRAAGLTSLEEMRAMILLLRADSGPLAAAPRLDRLDGLLAGARAAGLDVRLVPARPVPPLPAAVEQAAYRILQEALTNAAKHAPGGRVEVTAAVSGDRLGLRVDSEDGRRGTAVPGAGLGLLTMRERAESLGGRFAAGWSDDARSRWSVAAELPVGVPVERPVEVGR
ncbi:sensor histidine kinase [Geodermatophilus maliterrae]|uniref:histidine kinase n=1 Tax=Geodermatophilus maliterrae TaxID=3162531 RepID=A0ABV3XFB1_9ACTN